MYKPRYLAPEQVRAVYQQALTEMEASVLMTHLRRVGCPEGVPEVVEAQHQSFLAGLKALEAEYGALILERQEAHDPEPAPPPSEEGPADAAAAA